VKPELLQNEGKNITVECVDCDGRKDFLLPQKLTKGHCIFSPRSLN